MEAMNSTYWKSLERRREDLGISYPALSERAGVSVPTLKRLFSGKAENPTLRSLQAVCSVLGVELRIGGKAKVVFKEKESVEKVRKVVATAKARQIVKLVQGTSALESQAVSASNARDMVSRTIRELLTGPPRNLWAP